MAAENLALTGIRNLDSPTHSKWLFYVFLAHPFMSTFFKLVLLHTNHTTHHTEKKEKKQNYKAILPNLQQAAPFLTRGNILFPSSSHGPKVAVIIVDSQHGVREQFEVN